MDVHVFAAFVFQKETKKYKTKQQQKIDEIPTKTTVTNMFLACWHFILYSTSGKQPTLLTGIVNTCSTLCHGMSMAVTDYGSDRLRILDEI